MGLYDDLADYVADVLDAKWTSREGRKVPDSEDIKLGNDAVRLDAVVLYTDLSKSTNLVDNYKDWFAAKIYKTFLYCAAKVIRSKDGVLTSYDGDRVMGVFIGKSKNTSAAKAALAINYVRSQIITPALKEAYPKSSYSISHVTGVDSSDLFVVRTGIRGSNDLAWIGRSANHAAKLATSELGSPSVITAEVYGRLNKAAKYSSDNKPYWKKAYWKDMGRTVYTSTWWWQC